MKKIRYLVLLMLALTFSCNKERDANSGNIWKDSNAREFVDGIYASLGNGGFDEQMLSSLSDETLFTYPGKGINTVNEGNATAPNPGWISASCEWENMYKNIHYCNIALDKLGKANLDETMKNQLEGETYFLRAYFNHQLLRFYGGFIIAKTANTDINSLPRNTFEDCVNFIVSDCDSAAVLLKKASLSIGRVNSLAALALKSRVLLYASSDLHDFSIASAKSPLVASFTDPSLICYTTGNYIDRVQKAQQAANAALNAGNGYKLDLYAPTSLNDAIKNYQSIASGGFRYYDDFLGTFILDPDMIGEVIFGRYFSTAEDGVWSHVGLYNGPNGYHNKANNTQRVYW